MKSSGTFFKYIFIGLFFLSVISAFILYTPDVAPESLYGRYLYPDSKIISIDGMNVHYRETNSSGKETVLLLHGAASSLHTWDTWQQVLSKQYRVISVDLPGFGLTGPFVDSANDYSTQHYMQFLDHFLAAVKAPYVDIAGNSLGGFYAWQYALHQPLAVNKLILLSPGGLDHEIPHSKKFDLGLTMARMKLTQAITWYVTPRMFVKKSVENVLYDKSKATPELVDRYYNLLLRAGNRRALSSLLVAYYAEQNSYPALIKQIKQPVLLIWGDTDRHRNIEVGKLYQQIIPSHPQLIVYPFSGHTPMEENPYKTVEDARIFLESSSHSNTLWRKAS